MTDSTSDQTDHSEKIGPYKLLECLGEGGMGEVWLAEQSEPVHRRVALKIIKLGMDTRQVLARLEAERQALAVMDHPNIASFYDGGATEAGRPYFVMELVQGTSLTDYCDTNRLTTDERIRLFVDVCQAVQHAHHKGVVHRDLKPSNVLVTAKDQKPVVKIIDFGIAKALGHELTDLTLVTRMDQIIGTPEYMSPEQAEMSGLDVDTRTDVYSLGVMLYELLVGARPFDLQARADQAIRYAIRETDVPRPSTRLTGLGETKDTVARHRRTTVDALKKELKTDLDWIILKAMEKDRTRRYDTANGLALELERHLRHEPVLARAPTPGYRVGKFVKRHRMGVVAGGAVAAALVIGLTLATTGMVRARRAEQRAEQEAEAARQVSDFLVELFEVSDPSEARGNTITAREVLDKGAARIVEGLGDQPEVQGRLMDVMGRVYSGLGLYAESGPLLEQAVQVRRTALGDDHVELAQSLASLALYRLVTGRASEALPLAEEAHAISLRVVGPDDPMTGSSHRFLGWVYQWLGEFDKAQAHLDQALPIIENAFGPDHIETAKTLYRLGWQYRLLGDFEAARQQYERAMPIVEKELGPDSPLLAAYLVDLGIVSGELGADSMAAVYNRRALAIREKTLGPDHPLVAGLLNNLGVVEWQNGNYEEAQTYYQRSLEIQERAFGPESPNITDALNNLGLLSQARHEYGAALDYYERTLAIREKTLGPDHPDLAGILTNLGYLLRYIGDLDGARPLLERGLSISESKLGPDHPDLRGPLVNLGILFNDLGQMERARGFFERLLKNQEGTFGEEHDNTVQAISFLANTAISMEDYESADSLLERWQRARPDDPESLFELARLHQNRGDLVEADTLFRAWLEAKETEHGPESAYFAFSEARVRAIVGDREMALRLLQTALDRGFSDPWIARNFDLKPLHGDPRFQGIVAEVMSRAGISEIGR